MDGEVIPNVLATLAQVMDKLGKPDPGEITLKGTSAELRNLADYLLAELPCTADHIDNIEDRIEIRDLAEKVCDDLLINTEKSSA